MRATAAAGRIAGVAVLACLGLALAARAGDLTVPPPNILFILTDDQRWDAVGAYGNSVVLTPNLDRLAAEGARLDAFCVAAPLCNPSRASVLSGLYPHQHGVVGGGADRRLQTPEDLPPGVPTVATHLNAAGYLTGFIGKAHLGGDPKKWGFSETPVYLSGGASEHIDPELMVEGTLRHVRGHITQIFADAAIAFLDRHRNDRWFLWFATTAPHLPYFGAGHTYHPSQIKPPPGWPKGTPLLGDPAEWAGYYATISMLDEQIGRVLKELENLSLTDRTLVVFISDNGYMFGSHDQAKKQVWFEESVRVPALVRWPGRIAPRAVVKTPVVSVDLLPTFVEVAGQASPLGLEGVSMLAALEARPPLRSQAYAELQRGSRYGGGYWQMVRDERFKYVRLRDGGEHLYDLDVDPWEQKDLTRRRSHHVELARLRDALEGWLTRTPPPVPHDAGSRTR